MRRAPAWMATLATLIAWLAAPAGARAANLWVTFAAGFPGVETPSSSSEFYFANPHGSKVAVTSLTGGVTAEATTAGGNTFFGGFGTPVLLNLADGSAYIANGNTPPAARSGGAGGGTQSSSAPAAGGDLPTDAALLGIDLAEPGAPGGSRSLTASVTDSLGNSLGSTVLDVPDGGWWVIGLGPDTRVIPDPVPDPGPIDVPPPVDPLPELPGTTPPPTTGGAVATPEPGTLALAALGIGSIGAWRRGRLRSGN